MTEGKTEHEIQPKRPRPPVRVTEQVLDAAFEALASGQTLSDFCRQPGTPDRRSICRAIEAGGPEVHEKFQRARDMGFDAMAEEIMRLVDEPIPKDDNGRTDVGLVQQRRLQSDVRLRLLAKWATAKYGDRVQVDGGGVQILVVAPIVRAPADSQEQIETNGTEELTE